jgi:cation diffusion facilitator CzcD-associated flavoprotein CzcO
MKLFVDGEEFNTHEKMIYRGVLLEDLLNAGMVFGYTNASWTLKADLITEWMCRWLNHMDATGLKIAIPKNFDSSMEHRSFVDMESGMFNVQWIKPFSKVLNCLGSCSRIMHST